MHLRQVGVDLSLGSGYKPVVLKRAGQDNETIGNRIAGLGLSRQHSRFAAGSRLLGLRQFAQPPYAVCSQAAPLWALVMKNALGGQFASQGVDTVDEMATWTRLS